jgi:hypothetical protein
VTSIKGAVNADFLGGVMREYAKAIRELSAGAQTITMSGK